MIGNINNIPLSPIIFLKIGMKTHNLWKPLKDKLKRRIAEFKQSRPITNVVINTHENREGVVASNTVTGAVLSSPQHQPSVDVYRSLQINASYKTTNYKNHCTR